MIYYYGGIYQRLLLLILIMNKARYTNLSVRGEFRHDTDISPRLPTSSSQRKKLDHLLYIKGLGDGRKDSPPNH